jgi:hypothetical protein
MMPQFAALPEETEMVLTFGSMKAQMKRDEERIKRRGHDGLNEQDLRVMAGMKRVGDEIRAERERKKRLGIVDYYVPPPGKKYE